MKQNHNARYRPTQLQWNAFQLTAMQSNGKRIAFLAIMLKLLTGYPFGKIKQTNQNPWPLFHTKHKKLIWADCKDKG